MSSGQFYMIPAFRYLMLQAPDNAPDDIKDYKGRKVNDKLLYQFQKLAAHLDMSDRHHYDSVEFCFAFKDMGGQPTNTAIQQDTEEFFNIFMDRVEEQLKPTPQKYLLNTIFNGQNCSQMVCKECGFTRNRFEDFFNISLTVQNMKTIHDSLKFMISGEEIQGYDCPGCKKKVDLKKRTLIAKTPNALIFQLQRIQLDYNTWQKVKDNSQFEFPNVLDLKEFSLKHIMEEEGSLTPEMIQAMRERKQARATGQPEEGVKPDDDLTEEEQRE